MTSEHIVRRALWCVAAALLFFLPSCGSLTEFYGDVDLHVSGGQHLKAVETVRNNQRAYGEKNSVLYNMDLGLLFHYAGLPDSSNVHLFAAEREIDDLYTKSVSLAALSMLTNDNILPYDGEDFERALINVFLALNYAEKGESDEALVEARKVDLKLREFARQYEGKNRYQEDAFVRYVAGVLYESAGEINDAFISYRMSFEAYDRYGKEYDTPAPSFLLDDLVRTATLLSFSEEAAKYAALGGHAYIRPGTQQGSILVIVYAGKGPIKTEVRTNVSIADNGGTIHTFQIALPRFQSRCGPPRSYNIAARGTEGEGRSVVAVTERAEDVTAIASKALEDRLSMIYLKSGGRALLKFLAAEKVKSDLKKKDNTLANLLGSIAVDVVVGATEQADLRTWRTLPSEFQIARMNVPAGSYGLRIESSDGNMRIPAEEVTVRPGRTSFVIVDDVR
jgi:uncharacterized protein